MRTLQTDLILLYVMPMLACSMGVFGVSRGQLGRQLNVVLPVSALAWFRGSQDTSKF